MSDEMRLSLTVVCFAALRTRTARLDSPVFSMLLMLLMLLWVCLFDNVRARPDQHGSDTSVCSRPPCALRDPQLGSGATALLVLFVTGEVGP